MKFFAEIFWKQGQTGAEMVTGPLLEAAIAATEAAKNPDEIEIAFDDEDDEEDAGKVGPATLSTDSTTTISSDSACVLNPDEIKFDMDDEDDDENDEATKVAPSVMGSVTTGAAPSSPPVVDSLSVPPKGGERSYESTKFLALDKCEPHRQFLDIIDFPEATGPVEFFYDEEWLAIVRTLAASFSINHKQNRPMENDILEQ